MNADVSCPKCKARMEEGYVLDRAHNDAPAWYAPSWVEGAWVQHTVKDRLFGVVLRDRRQLPVSSYRCTSCGYLEAYAK
jgi:Domain of unknown function (DUF6487)